MFERLSQVFLNDLSCFYGRIFYLNVRYRFVQLLLLLLMLLLLLLKLLLLLLLLIDDPLQRIIYESLMVARL